MAPLPPAARYSSLPQLPMSLTYRTMTPLKSVMAALVVCGAALAQQDGQLNLSVIAGNDVVVSTRGGRGADIRVRVSDSANRPVENATVTAVLPALGAGGSFRGGHTVKTRTTGSDGLADFEGISLRQIPGDIPIRIVAHRGSQSVSTVVRQKAADSAPVARAGISKRKIAILAIAGGGITTAVLTALLGGAGIPVPAFNVTPGFPATTGPR